jgi:hypothetical protein
MKREWKNNRVELYGETKECQEVAYNKSKGAFLLRLKTDFLVIGLCPILDK